MRSMLVSWGRGSRSWLVEYGGQLGYRLQTSSFRHFWGLTGSLRAATPEPAYLGFAPCLQDGAASTAGCGGQPPLQSNMLTKYSSPW